MTEDDDGTGGDDVSVIENIETQPQEVPKKKSLMELFVIWMRLYHVYIILYAGFYYVNLDMPMLLVSVVPVSSRNVFTILLCLILDMLALSIVISWGIYVMFIIVSFILTFRDSVDLAIQRITR